MRTGAEEAVGIGEGGRSLQHLMGLGKSEDTSLKIFTATNIDIGRIFKF
jgi:hypothetical protein